jgi:hypothetical protein
MKVKTLATVALAAVMLVGCVRDRVYINHDPGSTGGTVSSAKKTASRLNDVVDPNLPHGVMQNCFVDWDMARDIENGSDHVWGSASHECQRTPSRVNGENQWEPK